MCRIEDSEMSDLIVTSYPRAAKNHACFECRQAISKGDVHLHSKSLYDGHWSSARLCQRCEAAAKWLTRECGGYIFGEIEEELVEHWHEGYQSLPLGRLIVHMRRRWVGVDVEQIRQWVDDANAPVLAGA